MGTPRRVAWILLSVPLSACGGGGNPVGPPTPGEVHSVEVLVFYDEDGDGQLDAAEAGRVPGVTVTLGGRSGRSAVLTGEATLAGVPAGTQELTVRPESLPPFYAAPAPLDVSVPPRATVAVPLRLGIAGNVPNRYMAFGDSITVGDGSSDGRGYLPELEDRLRQHFGAGQLVNEGIDGTRTDGGAARIGASLARQQPAYTLIHYGTNDWNKCKSPEVCNPQSAEYLRSMVQQVKAAGGLPVLATVIPVNVGYNENTPPQRNEYIESLDRLVRDVATQEGALMVDLEAAFYRAAGNDLSQLFYDHVHPNDRGYQIMADEFFKAISGPAGGSSASAALEPFGPALLPQAWPTEAARDPGRGRSERRTGPRLQREDQP